MESISLLGNEFVIDTIDTYETRYDIIMKLIDQAKVERKKEQKELELKHKFSIENFLFKIEKANQDLVKRYGENFTIDNGSHDKKYSK